MDKKNNTINKGFLTGFKNKKLIVFLAVIVVLIIGFAIVSATGGFGFFGVSAPSSGGGLVGYWSLAESDLYDTDIFQDLSGNGNNGTSANTPVYVSDQAGVPNQAMTFNGTTDAVNCGSGTTIDDIFDSGGTASAWINPSSDGEGGYGKIFSKWTGFSFDTREESGGDVKISFNYDFDGASDGRWATATAIIPINTWTHIAVNYDSDAAANNPTFYINGVPYTVASGLTEAQTPIGTRVSDAGATLYLGNNAATVFTFDGSISDVMLFSSTLTEDQVRQLYLSGRTTARIKVDARELITNGDFATDSDWDKANGATIAGGVGILDNTNASSLSQTGIIVVGKKYLLNYEVVSTDLSGGTFRISGMETTALTNAVGKYNRVITATGTYLRFIAFDNTSGTLELDNISIVDITNAITPKLQKGLILDMPLNSRYTEAGSGLITGDDSTFDSDTGNWTKGTGWTIGGNVASCSGAQSAYSNLLYADILTLGHRYYITADITRTAGTMYVKAGTSGNYETITSNQSIAFISTATGNDDLYFQANADFIGTVDNIIVKELDGITKDRTPQGNDGTVSGATIKYDGLVNAGAGIAYINQDKAYGTFEFSVNKGADGNLHYTEFIADSNDKSGDGYFFYVSNTEAVRLYRRDDGSGTIIMSSADSYVTINTDYRIKITRSLAGVFTVYIKGGAFGWDDWTTVVADSGSNPVTDNTYTTSNYLVADLDSGDTISNLKIDSKRISLAGAVQSTGTWTLTGDAYDFDGTDDYISITDTDDLSFGDGTDDNPFSISSWVYIDDATNFNIISKGIYNTDGEWRFYSGADDKVYFQFYDESVADTYVGRMFNTALTEGEWVSLIATYSGDSTSDSNSFFQDGIKIYLNGNRADNTDVESGAYVAMENLDHNVWLGRYNTDYANGQIRDIKVYNRVLNSGEIQSLSENYTDCPSDMVWVDYAWTWQSTTWSNRGGFCIDKYEASNGGGAYYVDINGDGDILDTAVDVYGDGTTFNETTATAKAVSEYNANPWISINQVNAKAACLAAGKRLATNYEWLLASKGTPDPHTSVPATGTESCQIWNTGAWPDYSGKKPDGSTWTDSPAGTNSIKTGTAVNCVSDAGAYDLIGNVWEWTDNVINGGLHPVTGAALPAQSYITGLDVYGIPSSTGSATTNYNYDHFWINAVGYRGFIRGGIWDLGSAAGLFALHLNYAPSITSFTLGFRCVR